MYKEFQGMPRDSITILSLNENSITAVSFPAFKRLCTRLAPFPLIIVDSLDKLRLPTCMRHGKSIDAATNRIIRSILAHINTQTIELEEVLRHSHPLQLISA